MQKYQYYDSDDDGDYDGYTANWVAQTFTVETVHMISKVKLRLFVVGDPGTITVSIKNTTAGKPTGADLCSGSIEGTDITTNTAGEWYEITLGSGYTFDINTMYAIVVRAPSGDSSNKISWRANLIDATYSGGTTCTSSDSGVDWGIISGADFMFEEWGVGGISQNLGVWGLLPKSQIDSETIETAIDRLINNHNEDEESHLGAGQALYSHKASEIIDHIVNSIIADKILDGEITRPKLSNDAVTFSTVAFDKGMINDFSDFSSSVSGTASIEKKVRLSHVKTGATQNSVAQIYTEICQAGDLWYCGLDLELSFLYYVGEEWGWEIAPGGEVYIKYGAGTNADMGSASNKCFGILLEDQETEFIKATGFVRDDATLKTEDLGVNLSIASKHVFTIKKVGSSWYFFVDDVLKATISEAISGTIATPYFTHVAKNPVASSRSEGMLSQVSYYFPW